MSVAIITSIYGGYDVLHTPVGQYQECEFVLVTDIDIPPEVVSPWRVVYEPKPGVEPRLASREAKCSPWKYTDADVAIWVDGDIHINSPWFVTWCLQSLGDADVCQRRMDRTATEEIKASRCLEKWNNDHLEEMLDHYLSTGYPDDYGIWWCGLIVRRNTAPDIGLSWLAEMIRWTCQDQISYSYIMYELRMKPKDMAIHYHDTTAYTADYFTVVKHPDCSI